MYNRYHSVIELPLCDRRWHFLYIISFNLCDDYTVAELLNLCSREENVAMLF